LEVAPEVTAKSLGNSAAESANTDPVPTTVPPEVPTMIRNLSPEIILSLECGLALFMHTRSEAISPGEK
jgi:hypothetical protein